MMKTFFSGFEKRAYDYAHEVDVAHEYAKDRYQDEPITWSKALGGGALLGSGIGGITGALKSPKERMLGGLAGAIAGAGMGALLGGGVGAIDRYDIAEQKEIMDMDGAKRAKYLASKEREREFRRREAYKDLMRDKD